MHDRVDSKADNAILHSLYGMEGVREANRTWGGRSVGASIKKMSSDDEGIDVAPRSIGRFACCARLVPWWCMANGSKIAPERGNLRVRVEVNSLSETIGRTIGLQSRRQHKSLCEGKQALTLSFPVATVPADSVARRPQQPPLARVPRLP